MNRFFTVLISSLFLFAISCSQANEQEVMNDPLQNFTAAEKARLAEIIKLFEGVATVDPNPTEEDIRYILNMREDSLMMLRDFFEHGFETVKDSVGTLPLSRGHRVENKKEGDYWMCEIYGQHTSAFAVSNTKMRILYLFPDFARVIGAGVTSRPSASFEITIPKKMYRFSNYQSEYLIAEVYVKHSLYSGHLTMAGYIRVSTKTGLAEEGEVEHFH